MNDFLAWYSGRSPREQRLLRVMGVLMAVEIAWLAIIRPLGDAHARARERHDVAVVAHGQARAAADAIGVLEKAGGPAVAGPLDAVVGRAAAAAGFELSQLQLREGAVGIAIEAARPQALFGWLAALETQGVIVDSLSATTNADRTLAVQATLRARGR
jgi:general secretion pathway protein M